MPQISTPNYAQFKKQIESCIDLCNACSSTIAKVQTACNFFLGTPYDMWCIGEGDGAEVSQKPIFRTDTFDCMTLTNTIIAILHSSKFAEFTANYIRIQYRGAINYYNRNYFLEEDWIQHNMHHYIAPYMDNLAKQYSLKTSIASTNIDYNNWLLQHSLEDIYYLDANFNAEQALQKVHASAKNYATINNKLEYFTIDDLLQLQQPIATEALLAVVVKPNWDIRDKIGTKLNVSHVGIVLPEANTSYFYHASSCLGKVSKQNFKDYLKFSRDQSAASGYYFAKIRLPDN